MTYPESTSLSARINAFRPAAESTTSKRRKLEKACHDFEAIFISYMLKVMRKSTGGESGGLSMGTNNPFQGMFDWELARQISTRSPLGFADSMIKHFDSLNPPATDDNDSGIDPGAVKRGSLKKLHEELKLKNFDFDRLTTTRGFGRRRTANAGNSGTQNRDFDGIIAGAARRHRLDPNLIRAVIAVESNGDPDAVSPKGAKGLMQLMDSTAADLGVTNPFDPHDNVHGGSAYLRQLLIRYSGDTALALAAYNAGPAAVDRFGGIPPYPETRSYVEKIMAEYLSTRQSAAARRTQSVRE